jgi:hypothetical protein
MNSIIIEQRDSVVRKILALYEIPEPPMPTPPCNKAYGYLDIHGHHAMLQIDAYHPDPADNGLTLVMLPSDLLSKEQAEEFFESYHLLDAQGYLTEHVTTRPLCAA